MRMIRTYVLLVPSHPVQLVADLLADLVDFDFEQVGGWDHRTSRGLMHPFES
jgi:hypothetical protein